MIKDAGDNLLEIGDRVAFAYKFYNSYKVFKGTVIGFTKTRVKIHSDKTGCYNELDEYLFGDKDFSKISSSVVKI